MDSDNDTATVAVSHDFDCDLRRGCACEVEALRDRIRELTRERDWMQAELERRLERSVFGHRDDLDGPA